MTITAPQCRAARALLNWNQDRLAESAGVARATIADFEQNIRIDLMRQNMISIRSTLEAAGIEFLPETEDGAGAGVRKRNLELEYSREGRMIEGSLLLTNVKFRGAAYELYVLREVLDDLGELRSGNDGDRVRVAQSHMGLILRVAEMKLAPGNVEPGTRVIIRHDDFQDGTF